MGPTVLDLIGGGSQPFTIESTRSYDQTRLRILDLTQPEPEGDKSPYLVVSVTGDEVEATYRVKSFSRTQRRGGQRRLGVFDGWASWGAPRLSRPPIARVRWRHVVDRLVWLNGMGAVGWLERRCLGRDDFNHVHSSVFFCIHLFELVSSPR